MKTSESIIKIAPALLIAQRKIGSAIKGSTNPFFKSSYADLGAVMEACKDALNSSEIAVLQPIGTDEVGVYVETVLLHSSGEWIADRMKISPKTDSNPQDQGSAISYARRYGLQSMCFIPAEDDDAERATDRNANKPGVSSEVIGKQLDNMNAVWGCESCHAPAGKPHASTCSTLGGNQ